jgi:hypothetical protein
MISNILILAAAGAASTAPVDVVAQSWGAALQADERRALALIKYVDATDLNDKDRHFVTCVRARFERTAPVPGQRRFADQVLTAYRSYWHSALLHPAAREAHERRLKTRLQHLLQTKAGVGWDELEPLVAKRLEAAGWHSIEGRTGRLRDLMMWSKQDERMVKVALPEGQYETKVEYLDGFKSLGWTDYATCGRAAAAGWATDSALFAVVPRYDSLEGEEFRVSFLGHETQHFADKRRFEGLESWELEYRAKLTELLLADTTRKKVLEKFMSDQSDDPAEPHSYADRKLIGELVERLQLKNATELPMADPQRLQSAARDLLLEDSRRRLAAAGTVSPSARN